MPQGALSRSDLETPVAMVVFNRPDLARRVLARLREVRPKRLFILADGPRPEVPTDAERCAATRTIVDEVDWDAKVETDYSDDNLGCSGRVISGMTKVFDQVETAIVIEDDIHPHPDFFAYAEELLTRYRDNPQVHGVTGGKYPCEPRTAPYSYRFSRIFNCWGWAGFARAWRDVDFTMSAFPAFRDGGWIDTFAANDLEKYFYMSGFEQAHDRRIEIWDWAVMFHAYTHRQLFTVPDRNLISNTGWGPEATQQKNENHILANLPGFPLSRPLVHPEFVAEDRAADCKVYDMIGPLTGPRFRRSIRKRIRRMQRNHFVAMQQAGEK